MNPPNIYYSAILFAEGIACLLVAVAVWVTRRRTIGSSSLTILLLALSWWDITYAIFWLDTPGPTPYFWLDITLMGAFVAPTAIFVFAVEHGRLQKWLTRPILLSLMAEPILAAIFLWTDSHHNLYYGGKRILNTTMILDAGVIHWANIYYSYAMILVAIIILVVVSRRSVGIYRRQTLMILAAIVIPWLVHISFISTGGLLPDADVTPFIFSITAIIFAFALINFRLLDLMPIARTVLVENMNEGVIVLDVNHRIVDINPAALKLVNASTSDTIGMPVNQILPDWARVMPDLKDVNQTQMDIQMEDAHINLGVSPLFDESNHFVGRLIMLRDITTWKMAQKELEKLAHIDDLTGTFNRRSFFEKANFEINRAMRHKHPLSVVMIDIDHFKVVNDRYGHPTGDQVLVKLSELCSKNIRDCDVFARFGGEEFALLMPETNMETAFEVSERLRLKIENSTIQVDKQRIQVTISLGISEFDGEADTLDKFLRRADQALYQAKQLGRNKTVVWKQAVEAR